LGHGPQNPGAGKQNASIIKRGRIKNPTTIPHPFQKGAKYAFHELCLTF
jgi:hypothetical protein